MVWEAHNNGKKAILASGTDVNLGYWSPTSIAPLVIVADTDHRETDMLHTIFSWQLYLLPIFQKMTLARVSKQVCDLSTYINKIITR